MSYDYDLAVIGGGAAGLTAAGLGVNLGAKTVMIEKDRLGGDCTWTGCIPSKTLLKTAKVAHQTRQASQWGLVDQEPEIDFQRVMEHVRTTRREVYEDADAPEIFEEMGVEVRTGAAHFEDPHTLKIEGERGSERLTARYVVIASGGRPFVPPIDGIGHVPYLTSETLFEIDEQPGRLAIVGGGPIGTEMAQAFTRLGTDVTVIDMGDRILGNDDPELAGMLQETLAEEGVQYVLDAQVERVTNDNGTITVHATTDAGAQTVTADALLMATGRTANVDDLNLEAAGVEYTRRGVEVDDRCRTNQPHVFAAGDVSGRYQFTHMSGHMAKVAVTNALLKLPQSIDTQHVPWVTYADPELAHVGATEEALQEEGRSYETYRFPMSKLDRAIAEHETDGLIKVFAKSFSGRILGVNALGAHAGDVISTFALAMKNGVSLRNIADTIHPYPAWGEGVRRVADQWYVQKQSTTVTKAVQAIFGYSGPVIEPDPERII
jgi:pyruvate/2-oxoglutarate dehydrogenase complex dihydrolipoamide dehydrogenase (E3) component